MSVMEAAAAITRSADDLKHAFKNVFSQLASGVCVVTFWHDGQLHGFTATSVTSVSLQPPRVLFCVAQASQSYNFITTGTHVGISILSAAQEALSNRFASRLAPGAYEDVAITGSDGPAPLIAGALGHLTAGIVERIPSGDHAIVLCDVTSANPAGD